MLSVHSLFMLFIHPPALCLITSSDASNWMHGCFISIIKVVYIPVTLVYKKSSLAHLMIWHKTKYNKWCIGEEYWCTDISAYMWTLLCFVWVTFIISWEEVAITILVISTCQCSTGTQSNTAIRHMLSVLIKFIWKSYQVITTFNYFFQIVTKYEYM